MREREGKGEQRSVVRELGGGLGLGGKVLRERSLGGMIRGAVRGGGFGKIWKGLGGEERKVVVGRMKKLV